MWLGLLDGYLCFIILSTEVYTVVLFLPHKNVKPRLIHSSVIPQKPSFVSSFLFMAFLCKRAHELACASDLHRSIYIKFMKMCAISSKKVTNEQPRWTSFSVYLKVIFLKCHLTASEMVDRIFSRALKGLALGLLFRLAPISKEKTNQRCNLGKIKHLFSMWEI